MNIVKNTLNIFFLLNNSEATVNQTDGKVILNKSSEKSPSATLTEAEVRIIACLFGMILFK
jgi:hypothetical protein